MILTDLFIGFLKVGCFSFGGAYGAIPLIRDVVLSYGWLTDEMLSHMIAVSESTPGPIMVNLATYIGNVQAGFPGAVTATSASVFPSFLIFILATKVLNTALKNPCVKTVLRALKSCIAGIVLATGIVMLFHCCSEDTQAMNNLSTIVLLLILLFIKFIHQKLTGKKLSPFMLIALAAVLGCIIYAS